MSWLSPCEAESKERQYQAGDITEIMPGIRKQRHRMSHKPCNGLNHNISAVQYNTCNEGAIGNVTGAYMMVMIVAIRMTMAMIVTVHPFAISIASYVKYKF